jgi:SAM-dependent methyltransferase
MPKPRTPKLPGEPRAGTRSWYKYYAGFSADFVRDVFGDLGLGADGLVIDPWNGSGTTTAVADELGVRAWGGDINPAMVVIAKARLLGWRVRPSEISLCDAIIESSRSPVLSQSGGDEPLRSWFRGEAASQVRALERAIASLLDPGSSSGELAVSRVGVLSPLAAFFYLALFRTVRRLLKPFRCNNPTWIRRPKDDHHRLFPTPQTIHEFFRRNVKRMIDIDAKASTGPGFRAASHLPQEPSSSDLSCPVDSRSGPTLVVAKSTDLPFVANSVAAVISSPPYCTRIDYAVATSPELAILGLREAGLRELREAMIGSSTVRADEPNIDSRWGKTCRNFLTTIKRHRSKASATYYLRNHLQYFDGLFRSLRELDRVLRPGAPCVLVVQDSHYKEIHNDLPTITIEMTRSLGWELGEDHRYQSTRHVGRLHRGTQAIEAALILRTAS